MDRNRILRKKRGGRGLKNLSYSYMGVKNYLNHPYVINKWPLMSVRIGNTPVMPDCRSPPSLVIEWTTQASQTEIEFMNFQHTNN